MKMHNPAHPGEILREEIDSLGFTVTEAAKILGVSRNTLSRLLNEKAGISIDMARKLAKAFSTSTEMWLRLQMQWDPVL